MMYCSIFMCCSDVLYLACSKSAWGNFYFLNKYMRNKVYLFKCYDIVKANDYNQVKRELVLYYFWVELNTWKYWTEKCSYPSVTIKITHSPKFIRKWDFVWSVNQNCGKTHFATVVNGWQPLHIYVKSLILKVWLSYEYTSVNRNIWIKVFKNGPSKIRGR